MRHVSIAALALSLAALLAGCSQDEPKPLHPTRSPGEAAWYESTKKQQQEYCAAYRAHDPQHPIHVPSFSSAMSEDEFADDFYSTVKKKCTPA
ncbi:hypothetical protein ACH4S8_01420 [Streptomyces sp. NPDC021080]|uniref:hypothetical protein n=1 Tax=Streptomyces sp. NPDC021080 TaxID=3365110 RepID=UPI0037BD2777